jgi:transposase
MSFAIAVEIRESLSDLRSALRSSVPMIAMRINMLIQLKKHGARISQRQLALQLGVSDKSVHTWRKTYIEGGLSALMSHKRKARVSKIFTAAEHAFLAGKLSDPETGIQGYTELKRLIEKEFGREFSYNTLVNYCKRKFKTKIKVARKSHVKKDENAVSDFKKTLRLKSGQSRKM